MNAEFKLNGARIETERLILRPFALSDLDDFYEYAKVEGVGEMAGWKHHESMEESLQILHMFIEGKHTFALVEKASGRAVGSVGLEMPSALADEGDSESFGCEIGYVLSKSCWGKGYMTEAVRAVLQYCFHELRMDWVTCAHFMENDRSRRVIEKCGFRYVRDIKYETQLGEQKPSRLYVIRK